MKRLRPVIPTVENVLRFLDPKPADVIGRGDGEVFAIAQSVYEGVPGQANDAQKGLVLYTAHEFGTTNVWCLRSYPRLPYPYSTLYAVASMLKTEQLAGRKCDWILWLDDDVIVPPETIVALRRAADPVERPFVGTVAYDRSPPFMCAVWDPPATPDGELRQWVIGPTRGVYPVAMTGLCCALWHRSLFEKVPQPWFIAVPWGARDDGEIEYGITPDGWFSSRCREAGLSIYVSCDVEVTHLGYPIPLNTRNVKQLRETFASDIRQFGNDRLTQGVEAACGGGDMDTSAT